MFRIGSINVLILEGSRCRTFCGRAFLLQWTFFAVHKCQNVAVFSVVLRLEEYSMKLTYKQKGRQVSRSRRFGVRFGV